MTFTITGRSGSGFTVTGCETVVRALEKAAELVRRGHADVLIADDRGGQYTPDQFLHRFRPSDPRIPTRTGTGQPPGHRETTGADRVAALKLLPASPRWRPRTGGSA